MAFATLQEVLEVRKEQIKGKLRVLDEERVAWQKEGQDVAAMAQGLLLLPFFLYKKKTSFLCFYQYQ